MSVDRSQALAERQAMIDRLANMPAAMRGRKQWLFWRHEEVDGRAGLQKVPYYINGTRRFGDLGGEADLAKLATFDAALKRLASSLTFTGMAFAFLKGDGLIGIDLDKMIDLDTGELGEHLGPIVDACSSYTERSPSRKGLHIIVQGECDSFKHDPVGIEVYCGDRYFACTGDRWSGTPDDVQPIKPYALSYLRALVDRSKEAMKAAKAAAKAPAPASTTPAKKAVSPGQGGNDFKRVNAAAYQALGSWVPEALPKARVYQQGYRITSKHLGRDLEEDLQLMPEGIMDFGEEQGLSPIDVVMKWVPGMSRPADALHWLAQRVGVQLEKRRLQLVKAAAPAPHALTGGPDEEPPPPPHENDQPKRGRRGGGGRGGKNADTPPDGVGGGLKRLSESFRLIYGTDAVWDGEQRITMAVKNLRLIFGNDTVKMWLASPDRRMVLQHDMVFEPGVEVGPDQVNLFDGLPMEPERCEPEEVAVMLELLRHLCSMTAPTEDGVSDVMDWVLKWLAYPLQNVGAKMRSALVFHGPQGTGKNLFFDCIRAMYGKYGRMVGQTELDDKFNDWLSAKLLIVGNEVVTRQELFHNKNKLKWIVSEDEIPIRGMHQTVRWESNHAQVVFLSNENQPIALEKDDRRHVVVYTPVAGDEDLYLRVADFLKRGGAAKFMYFLLRYDTEGFGEHTKPIMTEAKAALIELSLKPAERFINEWLQGLLPLPLHVCSAEQLYRVFRRWCDMTGERFPPPQAQFTRTAERHVLERVRKHPDTGEKLQPKLSYKVVNLKHESGARKAMRCWLPRGAAPPEGTSEGEWVAGAVDSFETQVSRYGRSSHNEEEPS